MFENGSDWVRVDFHLHTRADKEFKYDGEDNNFAREYVKKLAEEGIPVGIITNHNKFDLPEFKALRKAARKSDIVLLPGVELSVNDGANGVHCLIVFSDEWIENGKDYINPFLASAFPGKEPSEYQHENGRTDGGLIQTLELLEKNKRDFFVVFAHVEQSSGLWNEVKGGRITEFSQNPLVQKRCLGFQKVRSHEKQKGPCRTKVKNWWKYAYPAEVEGSDPKKIDEVGKGEKTFLKVGAQSFNAVKFALTDPSQRVSSKPVNNYHSYVKSMSFQGGLLDGTKIPFSPNLNCLIGIRGSGKSSVLECLRFALNVSRGDHPQDVDYKDKLIPHVLESGGAVIVEIVDIHGETYEIKRIYGHQPTVYRNGEVQKGVSINSTLLRQPLYFGQKDLAASGDSFGKDLVEKLIGHKLTETRNKIAQASAVVREKVDELKNISADEIKLVELMKQKEDLEFQTKQFKKYGIGQKLEAQQNFDEDNEHYETIVELAEAWAEALCSALAETDVLLTANEKYVGSSQKALFSQLNTQVKALKKSINDAKSISTKVDEIIKKLEAIGVKLSDAGDKKSEEFAKAQRELTAELSAKDIKSIDLQEYLNAAKKKSRLATQIAQLEKKVAKKITKENELSNLLANLNETWLEEFQATQKMLSEISNSQSALTVTTDFKNDKSKYFDFVKEKLSGHGLTTKAFNELTSKYPDLIHVYNDLEEAAKLFGAKADKFSELFQEHLKELLSFQVPNDYEIQYQGKPLSSHSLGQRASAMIIFILAQQENDVLIVDQPEDDLDNQTVYEDVVKLIQQQKPNKQFLLATHNANFPVLGDAEMIVSCSEAADAIETVCEGIDTKECQQRIVDIMEGGAEAFQRRKTIYQQWEA